EDLLAELGDLRRMLDRARDQSLAQNRTGGDPNAASPNAQEGEAGQQGGGQQGQQGQGGEGEQGQQGGSPGQQGGAQGGGAQGGTNDGVAGSGANRSGGNVRFAGGSNREPVPLLEGGARQQA